MRPTPANVGPAVPDGYGGAIARSIWNMFEKSGKKLGSGFALSNAGFSECVPTLMRTFGGVPEEVVQADGSTPISWKSRRNSQKRCGVAEFGVAPNPLAPAVEKPTSSQVVHVLKPM